MLEATSTLTIDRRSENSFDVLRLFAAFAVLVSHQFVLSGRPQPDIAGFTTLGGLAVAVFFVSSGYFVSASWDNDPRPFRFWWKRTLRLFPALFFVVALTVLVVGVIETNLPVRTYFGEAATWTYWKNATLVLGIQYHLPGVFTENVSPAVNGSLWTLPAELLMYMLVFAVGFVFRRRSRWVFPLLTASFAVGWLFLSSTGENLVWMFLPVNATMDLGVFFFAGATIHAFRNDIRLSPFWAMIGALVAFVVIGQGGVGTRLVMWVVLPPLVLVMGAQSSGIGRRVSAFGDVSYGVYLWAFPIQQIVIRRWLPSIGFVPALVLTALLTFAIAAFSWFLIERPALGLKDKYGTRSRSPIVGPKPSPEPLILGDTKVGEV